MITPEKRADMARMVRDILGPGKAVMWWETPNPMFGGVKPYYMILIDREEALYSYINDAYENEDHGLMRIPRTAGEKP